MDINEFKSRKLQMEAEIRDAAEKAVREFRADTGFSPRDIQIHLIDATSIRDENRVYKVVQVTTDVEI